MDLGNYNIIIYVTKNKLCKSAYKNKYLKIRYLPLPSFVMLVLT